MTRFARVALVSVVALASPLLSFAGHEDNLKMPDNGKTDNTQGVVRAVQQGKDTGMTRSDVVIRADAWRLEPAYEEPARRKEVRRTGVNYNDTAAFHK
jgi:hypothetical protein